MKVLLSDRKTIDRVGTHPKTQKVLPWIWCGWGTKGVWDGPIRPFVKATLEALKQQMPEPWEMLPASSFTGANQRMNLELAKEAGLLGRSTLFCYDCIEYEPSTPAAVLQLGLVRQVLKQNLAELPGVRGCFSVVESPIMVIPNLYLFARGTVDPSYFDQPDKKVLADLARWLGGPPELLIPAWSCLQLGLDALPVDLPAKLRAAKLHGRAGSLLPGGAARYLDILASQVDSRIRILQACRFPAKTPDEAAATIADAITAYVDWWKLHRWVCGGDGTEPFQISPYTGAGGGAQLAPLDVWCANNVKDRALVFRLAAKKLVARGVLTEQEAAQCMGAIAR